MVKSFEPEVVGKVQILPFLIYRSMELTANGLVWMHQIHFTSCLSLTGLNWKFLLYVRALVVPFVLVFLYFTIQCNDENVIHNGKAAAAA